MDITAITINVKESASNSKLLDKKCKICGGKIYMKQKFLFGEIIVPVQCECKIAAAKKKKIEEEKKEKQARLEKLFTNSLMDHKFRKSTFENWDKEKGLKSMFELGKRYSENFKECKENGVGLLIYGAPGNGKTYLTSCIANELLESGIPIISVSINGVLERIKQTFSRFGKEAESEIIRGLCNAELLILDDLGTENQTEWSKATIYNIIDSRYRNGLPIIITTNIQIDPAQRKGELSRLYGYRTEDRIFEMCTPVENTGKSIRDGQAKKKTELLRKILY